MIEKPKEVFELIGNLQSPDPGKAFMGGVLGLVEWMWAYVFLLLKRPLLEMLQIG